MRFLRRHKEFEAHKITEVLVPYGVELALGEQLAHLVLAAPARELYRFNARYFAARLAIPPHRALKLLAALVAAGLADLNWEVRCPKCSAQWQAFSSLQQAQRQQSCPACGTTFEADLDAEVVITFTLSETIRSLGAGADDLAWRQRVDEDYGQVTGHDLLTVQAFRDLLAGGALPSGESFPVRRMALLFTDLGGSTALYARKGDPRAYGLVREHFELLGRVIDDAGGAVVKTIGDVVMAVFTGSDQALAAGLEAQRSIAHFNQRQQLAQDEALQLKVGLHFGSALAVTLNNRLDYFGTTINAAARVEKLARAGEVILTAEARGALANPAILGDLSLAQEQVTLRGLEQRPFTIYRLRP